MDGYYKIRFDILDNAEYSTYLEEISALCDRAVFYYHPDGKTDGKSPHIHGLLFNYKRTTETLRNNTKKRFGLTGIQSCTVSNTYQRGKKMSEMSYQKYLIYMSKGKYDPVYLKGFSTQECDLAKDLWKEPPSTVQNIVIEPKEKVAPKLTQWQLSHHVETIWLSRHGDEDKPDYEEMLDILIEEARLNKTLLPDRVAANIIQDIQSRRDTSKYKQRVMRYCLL